MKVGACTIDDFVNIDLSSGHGVWGPWLHRSWYDQDNEIVVSVASTEDISPSLPGRSFDLMLATVTKLTQRREQIGY